MLEGALIIHSTASAPKLLHQNLVNKKINTLLRSIHPDFYTTNPILSGSYLIKLTVSPASDYGDYDFYFTKKENFESAVKLLNSTYSSPKKTKNSFSYSPSGDLSNQIQLIFKEFDLPEKVILAHDFQNCQIAWFNNNLYFSQGFKTAWKNKSLTLALNQLPEFSKHTKWLAKLTITTQRVHKYVTRYNLDLADNLKMLLLDSNKQLQQNKHLFVNFDFSLLNSESLDYFNFLQQESRIYSLELLQQTIISLTED